MTTALSKMERPIAFTAATGIEEATQRAPTPTANPGHGQDRRRNSRRRALKSARIVFNDGRCSMTCHILDASETGALIMPADILLCPDQFLLKPLAGPTRACEVVWRKGTRIGIRYC
jgi:hypothetical protein